MSALPAPFPFLPTIPDFLRARRRPIASPINVPRRGPWWRLPRVRWRDVLPAIGNFFALPMSSGGLPLRKDGLPMNDANGCGCCGSGSGSGPGPTISGCGCSPNLASYRYAITSFGIETCTKFARVQTSLPNLSIKHTGGSPNGTTIVTYQGVMPFGFCFSGWCYWTGEIALTLSATGCFEGLLAPAFDTISSSGMVSLLMDPSANAVIQINATGVFRQTGDSDPAHNITAMGRYFVGDADFTRFVDPVTGRATLTDCNASHTALNEFACCKAADCDIVCSPDTAHLAPFPCNSSEYNNVAQSGTAVVSPV